MEVIPNRGAATPPAAWGWGFCETLTGHVVGVLTCPGIGCHCMLGHTPSVAWSMTIRYAFFCIPLLHSQGVDRALDVNTSLDLCVG